MKIIPLKAFNDNYIWAIHSNDQVVVVDPGDANVVIEYLEQTNYKLTAILITHHHGDHVGGVKQLKKRYYNIAVFSNIDTLATHLVKDGTIIELPLSIKPQFKVIAVPGHTLDHVVYYGMGSLFCGDTLFSVGCGRVFEGTYQQMHDSLTKIINLDEETLVYPAHEYTLSNIRFAKTIEPQNESLQLRYEESVKLRENDLPTLPIKLGAEKLINPFLRCDVPQVKIDLGLGLSINSMEVFTIIRKLKDSFV